MNFVCIKFVGYNLKNPYNSHDYNCGLTNNISYKLAGTFPSQYEISDTWLQLSFLSAINPKTKGIFLVAAILLFYILQKYCGMYAREVDVTRLRKRALLGNG
jgi:hypothetical protein